MKNSKLSNYIWGGLFLLNLLFFSVLIRNWSIARNQRTSFVEWNEVIDVNRLQSLLSAKSGEQNLQKDWYNFIFIDLRPQHANDLIVSLKETMAKIPQDEVTTLLICQNDVQLTNQYKKLHGPEIMFIDDENLDVHRLFGATKCGAATVLIDKTGKVEFADIGVLNPRDLYLLLSSRVKVNYL